MSFKEVMEVLGKFGSAYGSCFKKKAVVVMVMNSTEDTDDEDRKSVTVNVGCHFVRKKILLNVVMS